MKGDGHTWERIQETVVGFMGDVESYVDWCSTCGALKVCRHSFLEPAVVRTPEEYNTCGKRRPKW